MYYIVVALSVLLAAFAQMLLKRSAGSSHSSHVKEYINIWVLSGYALIGISMLINIWALSKGVFVKELCTIEALGYLFIPILSRLFYNEAISIKKVFAILIVICGISVFFI